ncbi:hypothetical protein L2734_07645 [Parashewanella spongiae]|nr:hypothetical protein [Parashewanella spongiae]MCL1078050.1 hypothetical protein [Parashewanella spongiae]
MTISVAPTVNVQSNNGYDSDNVSRNGTSTKFSPPLNRYANYRILGQHGCMEVQPKTCRFNECPTHQATTDEDISFIISQYLNQQRVTQKHLLSFGVPNESLPEREVTLVKQWSVVFKHWQNRTGGDWKELHMSLENNGLSTLATNINSYMSSADKLDLRIKAKERHQIEK